MKKGVNFWYGSVFVIVALAAIGLLSMTGAAGSNAYAADHGRQCTANNQNDDYNKKPAKPKWRPRKPKCEPMVTLPADDSAHLHTDENPNTLEWWYWTGHLQTENGRWFGFETTFFSFPDPLSTGMPCPMQSVDQAITDIDNAGFHFTSSGLVPGPPVYVPEGYFLQINKACVQGGDGLDMIHGEVEGGYVFDLKLESTKDPVLQYCTGHIDYSDFFECDAESYYYSRERMKIKGWLRVPDDGWLKVTGFGWFDHQWGDQIKLFGQDIRWNWFAIQLEDGCDIMVYVMLKGDDPEELELVLSHGSFTYPNGHTFELEGKDITITPTGDWESKQHPGCFYDMGWDIEIRIPRNQRGCVSNSGFKCCDCYNLRVDPVFENQETYDSVSSYWEGVATVTGTRKTCGKGKPGKKVKGRAFVEMADYCN